MARVIEAAVPFLIVIALVWGLLRWQRTETRANKVKVLSKENDRYRTLVNDIYQAALDFQDSDPRLSDLLRAKIAAERKNGLP